MPEMLSAHASGAMSMVGVGGAGVSGRRGREQTAGMRERKVGRQKKVAVRRDVRAMRARGSCDITGYMLEMAMTRF